MAAGIIAKPLFSDVRGPVLEIGPRASRRINGLASYITLEWAECDRFQFDVPIGLPFVGLIVHYRDWLRPLE